MDEEITITVLKDPTCDPNDLDQKNLIRWRARLKMAWLSFWAMIIFTFVLWFVLPVYYYYVGIVPAEWVDHISDSIEWIYITFTSVILGYMGTTAWTLKGKKISVDERDF